MTKPTPKPSSPGKPAGGVRSKAWPANSVSDIETAATIVGLTVAVKLQLDAARKLRGNDAAVLRAARDWHSAATAVFQSKSDCFEVRDYLSAHWQGEGFNSFERRMKDNEKRMASNRDALRKVASTLTAVYSAVVGAYNDSVALIAAVAQQVAGLRDMWGVSEEKKAAARKALQELINGIKESVSKLKSKIAEYNKSETDIFGAIGDLEPPLMFREVTVNVGSWNYK